MTTWIFGALMLATGAGCFLLGYSARPAPLVITKTKTEEVVKWREKTVAVATAKTEQQETVRVVTRWLRPDKSLQKETVREIFTTTAATQASSQAQQSQGASDTVRASESRTGSTSARRFAAGGMLGFELREGLERRWGGYLTVRIVGPLTAGAWAVPGMGLGGVSLGLVF